ncbi:MAG: LysR substrate-binding domain-containing protein [Pseudomonadota bacterium]
MNLRDLEYLVAVADELHFGRAAERCNASQPALSGQLRKLEDNLGVKLFERTKRHVRITEVGAEIAEIAQDILKKVGLMREVALSNADPLSGSFTLGAPPTIGPYIAPLLLKSAKHYMPNLRLELVEDLTQNLEQQLSDGDLDAALLATHPTHMTLAEIALYDEPFWVALPRDHSMADEDALDASAINPSELLLLADGHCLRDQIYEACKIKTSSAKGDKGPKTQRTSLSTILTLVGSGMGVTLVPATSLSGSWVTDGGVVVRPERSGTAGRKVWLVHRKAYHRMPLVEKLADVIVASMPNTVTPTRR